MFALRSRHLFALALVVAVSAFCPGVASASGVKPGTLHVISVGSNGHHSRLGGSLLYAEKDARDFAALFKAQEGKLFARVNLQTLTWVGATRARIKQELEAVPKAAKPG